MSVVSDLHLLEDSLNRMEYIFLDHHLEPDTIDSLIIASSEIISNAMKHGNHFNPDLSVSIQIQFSPAEIVITIKDHGKGFSEDTIENPLLQSNLMKTEGRGIFMARHLMDHVQFNFTGTGTETILTKHL